MRDLVSRPGIELEPPALTAQSLTHCTREVPLPCFLNELNISRGMEFLGRSFGEYSAFYPPLLKTGPNTLLSGYLEINSTAYVLRVPHLHCCLIRLQLYSQWFPDAQFFHVHQSTCLTIYAPGLTILLGVLGL